MSATAASVSLSPERGFDACRAVIPLAGVLVFAAFALLWLAGWDAAYFGIQRALGTNPFRFPFLDTHALLSAAECQRQGIDVYIQNPCDALGRVHAYSPLWLSLIPGFLGTGGTAAVGLGLDLIFILSLGIVLRPRSWGEVAVFALAVFSPITLFAVERANCDLIIFLLLTGAALLWTGSERMRLLSYAVCLFAGALKYFPMVALSLIVRERWRRGFILGGAAGLAIVVLVVDYRGELRAALANIPAGQDYFGDVFSARNLPLGFVELLGVAGTPARIVAAALFVGLGAAAISRGWAVMRLLARARSDWDDWEMRILAIGSLVLPACFFTAQNVAYRCVYLLLVMPGLVRLRGLSADRALRRGRGAMIAVCLVMLWECAIGFNIGRLLHQLSAQSAASGLYTLLQLAYWLGRELLWWWLVAGFLGIAAGCLRTTPLFIELLERLRAVPGVRRRRLDRLEGGRDRSEPV